MNLNSVKARSCQFSKKPIAVSRLPSLSGTTASELQRSISGDPNFMHDTLYRGKPFRTLNVIDESNREHITIQIDFSLPAARVIRVLEQLEEIHGLPEAFRLDNGPELRAAVFTEWCESKGIELKYIQPGSPSRMPSLNALTEPIGMKCSMPICSMIWNRLGKSPRPGSGHITKNAYIGLLGSCRPNPLGSKQRILFYPYLIDRGDYSSSVG